PAARAAMPRQEPSLALEPALDGTAARSPALRREPTLSDPTQPQDEASIPNTQSEAEPWLLQSTVTSPGRTFAVINGVKVKEGEEIDGAKLVRILPGRVMLLHDHQEKELRMKPQGDVIPLIWRDNSYYVKVSINGSPPFEFILDTGATRITIPSDVVAYFLRVGLINDRDLIGEGKAEVADGSKVDTKIINLRSLRIGSITLRNVKALELDVANKEGSGKGGDKGDGKPPGGAAKRSPGPPPLLGMNVLRQLGEWRIDQVNHRLIITSGNWRLSE
ncbi:MAG: retroviral-like aspartic protease family protein, partial [Magnetococcales bacterium]|nr:retroviral-like aspartic protease family protein [Magnetococcales bacterium]